MIEIAKACTVALVVQYREKHVNWEKNRRWWKFDFAEHRKVIHGSTKLFMADLLSNGLHEKVNDMLLKVD